MDSRFGQNNQHTGDQAETDDKTVAHLGKGMAQLVTDGHKAHIDTGEEQHQSRKGQHNTNADPLQSLKGQLQKGKLADHEEHHNQAQSNGNLFAGMSRRMEKTAQNISTDSIVRHLIGQAAAGENAQEQHRNNRTYRTKGHQAKAVILGTGIAQNRRNTNTQRHDERHRNRTGGDTAGIKGHGQKIQLPAHCQQKRQSKHQHIKQHKDMTQTGAEHDPQNGHNQERTHTHADSVNQ